MVDTREVGPVMVTEWLVDAMDRLARACEADPLDLAVVRSARMEVDAILDHLEGDL